MALETRAIDTIIHRFKSREKNPPNLYFENGMLWADTDSEQDAEIIKQGLESVIINTCRVKVSKIQPTKQQPWSQYSFEVTAPEGI